MYYTCLRVSCDPEFSDLLIAEIGNIGFDSFLETETGFEAYTESEEYDKQRLLEIQSKYTALTPLSFSFDRIEKENWNELWEKSFDPILVEDTCLIRADFHTPDKHYPYELIITPKMSFGTGHHQTTYLMIKNQLSIDHKGMRVMDAGCGTAILSIMACKLGASAVEAFDIDEWSVSNGHENIAANGCVNINQQLGKLSTLSFDGKFDIILANINKNVLLDELELYASYLKHTGILLMSGFHVGDIPELLRQASPLGLSKKSQDNKDEWAALILSWA